MPKASQVSFTPLTGLRRTLSKYAVVTIGRVLLMAFGCWPGLFEIRGKWDPTCSVCAAAPHAGAADAFVFLCLSYPRPVILEPYSKIPVVKQILRASGALLVPLASATKGMRKEGSNTGGGSATNATRDAILQHKQTYDPNIEGVAPIVLFSEGITHAGHSLLPFFKGAFEGGTAVQPIYVQYHYKYNNAHSFLNFTLGTHFYKLLTTPWMAITVDYLPAHQPTVAEAQDGALMAEAVRADIARVSELPMHTLGARELRKEMATPKDAKALL